MTSSMDPEDDLPREKYEHERLRYQWYLGYDREDEYEKDPSWSADMKQTREDADSPFGTRDTRFYDRFDPEHMWIRSDITYDLTQTL